MLESGERRVVDQPMFVLVGTILGAAFVYLVVLALADANIASALPLLVGTLAAGTLALYGWHRDRLAAVAASDEQRRGQLHNRRLRRELMQLHGAQEALADPSDVPAMIVRIAIRLLEAEKGMLLAAQADDPQRLDLASAVGFEPDSAEMAVAVRLGARALDRDRALRTDHPLRELNSDQDNHAAQAVEQGLQNLVAVPVFVQDDFRGVVVCANRAGGFGAYDDDVLLSLGDQAGAVLENGRLQVQMRDSYVAIVRMLAETIRVKDPSLASHSDEVSDYVLAVAQRLTLSPERREHLRFGSLLHDVGKIAISEQILLKPDSLTEEETEIVRLHPRIGARLAGEVPALEPLAEAILHHHERFDGTGYPDGLAGEAIPLEARIIAVADAFSAMTAERRYRRALAVEEALGELERCAGSWFDPKIVEIFVEEVRRHPPVRHEQPLQAALNHPSVRDSALNDGALLGHPGSEERAAPDSDDSPVPARYSTGASAADSDSSSKGPRPVTGRRA